MNNFDTARFFAEDYTAFSAYDNVRKIAHAIDGHKNASRKILHFVMNTKLDSFTKVSNLSSKIQDQTSYLHGSLSGTVVNNAQDFVGTNNLPMLIGSGTFGTRFINEAAADRYILAKFNPLYSMFFNRDDYEVLEHQDFEGDAIEPKYYVPTVPLLLLNGSNGISVGYSQKILPRRLDDLIRAVALRLKGKPVDRIAPYYKGFKGTIEKTDVENQWRITGTFERQTKTQIVVTELPVGYDLKGYVDVLERLEESGKIRAYADESENDQFRFVIGLSREIGSGSDEELISLLKLSKNVSENFTAIDTENRVQDFKNEIDIIDYWLKVRLQYNDLRKASMLKKIQEQIVDLTMKRRFIGAVLDHKIIIERRSKNDILDQMKTFDSAMFEYNTSNNLLNMPLWSITEERISELDDKISKTEENRKTIEETSLEDMVVQDLKTIKLPKGL